MLAFLPGYLDTAWVRIGNWRLCEWNGRCRLIYNACVCEPQVGLPEAARVKRYIPFSDGRRDCVGQALGRLNYTSTLARLLGNFHFDLAPEVNITLPVHCWQSAGHFIDIPPGMSATGRTDLHGHCNHPRCCRLSVTSSASRPLTCFGDAIVQSGGAEAVEAEEAMTMTLQPGPRGLLMRCIPRAASSA